MMLKYSLPTLLFTLSSTSLAQSVDGSKFNHPTGGPPPNYFAAAGTIPVAALQNAAAKANISASNVAYPINRGSGAAKVTMHSDWIHPTEVIISPTVLSKKYTDYLYRVQHLSGSRIWTSIVMV